jgi:hypothetical protein
LLSFRTLDLIKSYRWLLLGLLLWSGCRHGLPEQEFTDMHNLQSGWMRLMEKAEDHYVTQAERHNKLLTAVTDTTNHWRQAQLSQDTVLRLRIERLTGSFDRASRRHLFQLKELRSFLEDNEIWLMRIDAEGAPRRQIRGSWEARSNQFTAKMNRILASQAEFEVFAPDYDLISQRIPGMTDAPASPPAEAGENPAPVPVVQPIPAPAPIGG